jgi:hypothetical protein
LPSRLAAQRGVALANGGRIDSGFGNECEVGLVVPYSGVPTIYKNVATIGARSAHGAGGRFAGL